MAEPRDLGAAVAAQARHRPNAVALVHEDTSITYGELLARAEKARLRLVERHRDPGEPVCLVATKTPDTVATILACLLTGRPFLLPSTALPDDVVDQLAAVAGCRTVWAAEGQRQMPQTGGAPVRPAPGTSFMLTTSGSTGLPKVVPLPGAAVARFAEWASSTFDIGAGSTVLNYAPLNFDLCLLDVWTTLAHGGRVVLVDPDRAANHRYLADLLLRYQPHVVQAVPMLFALLDEAAEHFGTVRHVMVTGDAVSEKVLSALPRLFPGARRWNIYGCTETNDSFTHEFGDEAGVPVPIGHPLPGVEAVLVDADGGILTGPGVGELWVHTPFQTTGYLTPGHEGKFGERPGGADGRRWFRTGDLVRRGPDQALTVVGRVDFQVKVRGVAINTAEVERVLLDHPEVVEAAAVALPDPVTGHRLAAAVRRAPATRLNSLALRKHCARRLPQAAIPSALRFVEQPLPRTSTGKVDRTAVGRLFEQPEGRTP